MKLKQFNSIMYKIDIVVTLLSFTILMMRFNQIATTGDFLLVEVFAIAGYDWYNKIKQNIQP